MLQLFWRFSTQSRSTLETLGIYWDGRGIMGPHEGLYSNDCETPRIDGLHATGFVLCIKNQLPCSSYLRLTSWLVLLELDAPEIIVSINEGDPSIDL